MKTTFPREFYIPKNSIEIKAPDCSAVAYLCIPESGCISAAAFGGKRARPDWHYSFRTEADARARIAQHAAGIKASEEMRAKWTADRQAGKCGTPEEVWQKARAGKSPSDTDIAVCLRAVLAREFPGVKFSVRTDRSLNVRWTDGPVCADVEAIAKQYSFQGFDGMVDCRYYKRRWLARDGSMSLAHSPGHAGGGGSESIGDPHSPDAILVESGPDFVFCTRTVSPAVKRELAGKICARYGVPMPAEFATETDLERWLNTTRVEVCCNGNVEYLSHLVWQASEGRLDWMKQAA